MSIVLALPLDLSGDNAANRRTAEEHSVVSLESSVFALSFGPFYTNGLKLRHAEQNRVLVPNEDYIALHFYEEAARRSGLEVMCAIYITNPDAYGTILVDYQAVGGEFVNMISVIEDLIENLSLDNRPVQWGDLIGLPDTFPPAAHFHDLGDLYGFEYLTQAMENLRQAILMGDQAGFEEVYLYIDRAVDEVFLSIEQTNVKINAHESDIQNPHMVTKAQVGLGVVENLPLATRAQAEAGGVATGYMTPLTTAQAIAHQALLPLTNHVNDKQNPHGVTKAQVGLGSVSNFGMATSVDAQTGTSDSKYMSPARTLELTNKFAVLPLTSHVNDKNNPHGVTKAQVGLEMVQNFPIASAQEARNAGLNNRYMTPVRVFDAIETHVFPPLNNHTNNRSNPHGVTKAQVGLSQVQNYPIANEAQALDAGNNSTYLTPARAHAAIDKKIADSQSSTGAAVTGVRLGTQTGGQLTDEGPMGQAPAGNLVSRVGGGSSSRKKTVWFKPIQIQVNGQWRTIE